MTRLRGAARQPSQTPATGPPALARAPSDHRGLKRISARSIALIAAALVVAYLAVVPVVTMLYASLRTTFLSSATSSWTLDHVLDTARDPRFGDLVATSARYSAASAALATTLGFCLAWLVARTDCPWKPLIWAASLFPLILPGILGTMAWTLLLSPDAGALNKLFRVIGLPTFDIYTVTGMVLVEATHLAPLAFLMGLATFTGLDSSMEEASRMSGAKPFKVFSSVTLPLVRPGIISAGFLMFVLAISTFEVPQLIGVPGGNHVFVTKIFSATKEFPPDYGTIGAIGLYVLIIATAGLLVSQYFVRKSRAQTITGKGFRPTTVPLGRWRLLGRSVAAVFFIVTAVLPMLMLLWSSVTDGYRSPSIDALSHLTFDNYRRIFETPSLLVSARNSVLAALISALIVTAVSTVVAFITVKTKTQGRGVLDFLAMVPIAVPSIIIGVGILFWYLVIPLPIHLYGTLTILVIAYVTVSMPYSMQYMVAGMNQIHQDMEDASSTSGGSWGKTIWKIYLPLLRPALLASALWAIMLTFREVSGIILLYTNDNQVLAVTVYNLWSNGNSYPLVAALGVLMTLLLVCLLLLMHRISRGQGLSIYPTDSKGPMRK
ncbi:ABC transporter permease [Rhizomonospora bruguierae]|uniref:ABC transporter permease n=1 Tax=Rhizomonospora bruguierae TaxID=1581705 RepID=UPI001BCE3A96|nr:iron ABC transporter permease [Micromonospora sp. NBRC 107566]